MFEALLLAAVISGVEIPVYRIGADTELASVTIPNNTRLVGTYFQKWKAGTYPALVVDGDPLEASLAASRLPIFRFSSGDRMLGPYMSSDRQYAQGEWGSFICLGGYTAIHNDAFLQFPANASTDTPASMGISSEQLVGSIVTTSPSHVNEPYAQLRFELVGTTGFLMHVDVRLSTDQPWKHAATFETQEDTFGPTDLPPELLENIIGWRSEWNLQRAWFIDVLGPGDTAYSMESDLHKLVLALAPEGGTTPVPPTHTITTPHVNASNLAENSTGLSGIKIPPTPSSGLGEAVPPWATKTISWSMTIADFTWAPSFTIDLTPIQGMLTLLKVAQIAILGVWSVQAVFEEFRR